MPKSPTRLFHVFDRASIRDVASVSDRELLRRYADDGDQDAFAILVQRYSRLVVGACCYSLVSGADAEDVCQATFLVLAQKAKNTRWRHSVANWLFTTGCNLARKARTSTQRRATREQKAAVPEAVPSLDTMSARELLEALREEIEKLPVLYREPLVLNFLEDMSREKIAERLGIPAGTVKIRLERGKKRLGDALAKRGVMSGFVLLAFAATSRAAATTPKLIPSILAAVDGSPSASVAALAKGGIMNTALSAAKQGIVLAACVAVVGFGFAYIPMAAEPQAPAIKSEKPATTANAKGKAATNGEAIPKAEVKERIITGRVVGPDGRPLAADLSMVWQEGQVQPLGKTMDDGTFKVTLPLKRGKYGGWLVAKASGGYGMDFLPHGIESSPESMTSVADLLLKLPKERPIKGRLLDQQGKPVVGATVVASRFSAFDSDVSTDGHLKKWATEYSRFGSAPEGDRNLRYSDGSGADARFESTWPYSATTGKDGRFAIAGTGSGHLVGLCIRGAGVADREIAALNRDGFDPDPLNKAVRDHDVKGYSPGKKWVLHGADPVIVMEPEKLIRGTVTDSAGKPRAGVTVAFTRPNKRELTLDYNTAVTDKDGKYEIRGARKHPGYMVEVPSDPVAGLLPCQGFADETAGYEPITINLKCAKGVVIAGKLTDKETGKPIVGQVFVEPILGNDLESRFPPMRHSASMLAPHNLCAPDGSFQIVSIPGPVLFMAGVGQSDPWAYKPVQSDPDHPKVFARASDDRLVFFPPDGAYTGVRGNWCKVLNLPETAQTVRLDIALEPATKTIVKVVGPDAKPITDVHAIGVTYQEAVHPSSYPGTDTLTVYNLEPTQERLLAVVHEKRALVGSAIVKADDKNPVVQLGVGAAVTGRVVDREGKPLTGLKVDLKYLRREVTEISGVLTKSTITTTDANGEFYIGYIFPNQEFHLVYHRGTKRFDPDPEMTAKHTIANHFVIINLGDLKLEPNQKDGEE